MKQLLLLSTGGTIACADEVFGRTPQQDGAQLLAHAALPPHTRLEVRDVLRVDSTDMTDAHRLLLARTLWDARAQYDGFVITHGTDTMAYTAAFLYRVLPHFDKPIVLTGSQLPMDTPGSDAPRNLTDALLCAVSDYRGAAVCFAGKLWRGCCVTKCDAWDANAFDSGSSGGQPDGIIADGVLRLADVPTPGAALWREPVFPRAAVLTVTPLLTADTVRACAGYDALLLYGYGMGGVPERLEAAVRAVLQSGTRVYLGTQCRRGGAQLEVYAVGQRMQRLGVQSLGARTLEDAVACVQCGLL